ncbi:MAG: hypothetical protein ACR2QM_01610 [Longimicrobiales bacterium]
MKAGLTLRAAIGAASIFVLGAVAGISGYRWVHAVPVSHVSATGHHEAALRHLREELHLDEHQVAIVDSVVREHQSAIDSAWAGLRPGLTDAVDSVHAHLQSVLRPDQLAAFHEFLQSQGRPADLHSPRP